MIDGVVDFLSGRYREIERQLEERIRRRADAQGSSRPRSNATGCARSARCSSASGSPTRPRNARRGGRGRRGGRRQRPGLPGPRRSASDRQRFYLHNGAGAPRGSGRGVLLEYYGAALAIPPQVMVQAGWGTRHDGGGAGAAPRRRGRAPPCRARRQAPHPRAAKRNAKLALDQERLKTERRHQQRVEALDELQEALGLDTVPMRIECFDISNLMGTDTVAAMVVFEGGAPKKSDYRRFTSAA